MRELAGAGLGEVDAVAGSQAAGLAFEIRPLLRVTAAFIDKPVPHVDEDGAGLLGAGAIEFIEIDVVGRGFGRAYRRQADPEHRHAFALQRCNRVVDTLVVELDPLLGAEFVGGAARRAHAAAAGAGAVVGSRTAAGGCSGLGAGLG